METEVVSVASREEARVAAAAQAFVDRVVDSNALRILLGQPEPDDTEKERRGMQAPDDALGAFGLPRLAGDQTSKNATISVEATAA
ncbi:hypothetical protein [Chelativorans alearense]|uniref:hypothetical protein n=1 Tax=Chelativorans alearense TaxID=2681495 RepID=UPI0013D6977A|nr:hypothetical protein [Chelativorans alearense]